MAIRPRSSTRFVQKKTIPEPGRKNPVELASACSPPRNGRESARLAHFSDAVKRNALLGGVRNEKLHSTRSRAKESTRVKPPITLSRWARRPQLHSVFKNCSSTASLFPRQRAFTVNLCICFSAPLIRAAVFSLAHRTHPVRPSHFAQRSVPCIAASKKTESPRLNSAPLAAQSLELSTLRDMRARPEICIRAHLHVSV